MPRWPERITAKYLAQMTQCLRIGDLVILPGSRPSRKDFIDLKKLVLEKEKIRKILPDYLQRDTGSELPERIYSGLETVYREHVDNLSERERKKRRDPGWLKKLPNSIQAALRYHAIFERYDYEAFVNNAFAPLVYNIFLGFEYMLLRGGLIYDVYHGSELWRQHSNPQLSNKTDPLCSQLGIGLSERRSVQSREMHCLDMYPLAFLVDYNNRRHLSSYFRRNFRAASSTHDAFMPTMGDEVMEFDKQIFCEVKNMNRLGDMTGWKETCRRQNISTKFAVVSANGEGVSGDAEDKIDKIAYTALDLTHLVRLNWASAEMPFWLRFIFDTIKACPDLCTVWDSIVIENGKVYFTDPVRLSALLVVRAANFRWIYYGKHSRSTETILAKSVLACMYHTGKIGYQDFREQNREYFDQLISNFIGHWRIMDHAGFALGDPRVETFTTLEDAYRREKELFDQGIVLSAIEDCRGKINPATHFLVQTPDGQIMPFHDAFPRKAEKIHRIAHISRPIYLMYLNDLPVPEESYLELHAFKRERFAQRGQFI